MWLLPVSVRAHVLTSPLLMQDPSIQLMIDPFFDGEVPADPPDAPRVNW